MNAAAILVGEDSDLSPMQNWFNANPQAIVRFVLTRGNYFYVFYD